MHSPSQPMCCSLRAPAQRLGLAVLAAGIALTPVSATASDGAREIHQACVATGCFPGDPPGFPVLITEAGSYVLTSNLQVPDENTTAIDLDSDSITLDLGGFIIQGVTDCGNNVGDPCAPTGSGQGISGGSQRNNTVRNGTVRGMGGSGVSPGFLGQVLEVRVSSNGGQGINLLSGTVRECVVRRSGANGILAHNSSTIRDSVIERSNGNGIDCIRCTVTGNTIAVNGGAGVDTLGQLTLIGNQVVGNLGPGLDGSSLAGYGQNVFVGNGNGTPAGQVLGGAIQLGTNLCHGAVCP